ncbi:hypothetical protein NLU13_9600 [Sarocladium strictum]|uniref:Conserved oligomeric Golgi complex subunit 2 n=1 Tax=Sarocladium strictum TaxID=5046 RepID=A0AA39L4K4_SARSR|nr:hypothetical protein NLU13_9600 [Sarocladium strictum]
MASKTELPIHQNRAPGSNNAAFNLPSSTSSSVSDLDDSNADLPLPFPAALPRSDFLSAEFQPAAYLSALPHRHQTLEDLRSDLRDRSASISTELLELVNSNYTAFLSLGDELRGGDDKVEDVRVALLGFRRAVEDVRGKVAEKKGEADKLSGELRSVRGSIEAGRQMIEVSERLAALEERLSPEGVLDANGDRTWDSDEEEDSEAEDDDTAQGWQGSSPAKLLTSAQQCAQITEMMDSLDLNHPFVLKLEERLERCRNTLLLDLGNAVVEAKKAGAGGHDRLFRYTGIYGIIDAHSEAVKALRNS